MTLCIHCGRTREDHCDGFERSMPAGCVCAAGSWGDEVTPICDRYQGDGQKYCLSCEHDKECHNPGRDGGVPVITGP